MLKKLSGHLTYANVMATVAVFIVLGGGAYALTNRDKQQIKQIAKKQAAKLDKQIELTPGPKGDQGPKGDRGPKGDQGIQGMPGQDGQDGSPDTAGQVLAKLLTVDGVGSLLDADFLDGKSANDFLAANGKASDSDQLDGLDSSDFVQATGATFTSAGLPDSPGSCTSLSGWYDRDPNIYNEASYYRDPAGMVYLRGFVINCSGNTNITVFTLPDGFRPNRQSLFGTVGEERGDAAGPDANGSNPRVSVNADGQVQGATPLSGVTPKWISLDGIVFRCAPSGQDGCP